MPLLAPPPPRANTPISDPLARASQTNLKSRALNLKEEIKGTSVHTAFAPTLRAGGEPLMTIQWILEVQVALLAGAGVMITVHHFGLPRAEESEKVYFEGHLPSIKKTKETIMAQSPKGGPSMHDTPPSVAED